MITPEDQVLERELGRIGERRDLLLFGLGGLLASKLASKITPTEKHEVTFTISLDATEIRATTSRLLKSMGKLVTPRDVVASDTLWAHIGAGYLDTQPTIVCVEFIGAPRATRVVIKGASKEALLVKRRSAFKAVEEIKAQLLGEKVPSIS